MFMIYWSYNCRITIEQDEDHGQIVKTKCVAAKEHEKGKWPIWQVQTQKPLGEEIRDPCEKIVVECLE
jgi:hypothetical protein